jgi:hypothetical protein
VFIKELVPRRAVATIARMVYGENYTRVPMSHRIERDASVATIRAEYAWRHAEEQCRMRIETEGASFVPTEGSEEQFITEHYCLDYEVRYTRGKSGGRGRLILRATLHRFMERKSRAC